MINNLKKLAKTVVVVSAAALASTVGMSSASAFSLRYESGEGTKVVGIDNLLIEGEEYNIDFVFGSYDTVFDGSFDFDSSSAQSAAEAIKAALANDKFVWQKPENLRYQSDLFDLPFEYAGEGQVKVYRDTHDWLRYDNPVRSMNRGVSENDRIGNIEIPWAVIRDEAPAETPEPSLILGFITVGGLMLGSKRKNKG